MKNSYLKNKYYNIFFLILVGLLFFFNNGATNIFNGLPWINKFETIIILIVLPIILVLNFDFLKNFIFRLLITILVLLKLILIWAPQVGIGHKIYHTSDEYNKNGNNSPLRFFLYHRESSFGRVYLLARERPYNHKLHLQRKQK